MTFRTDTVVFLIFLSVYICILKIFCQCKKEVKTESVSNTNDTTTNTTMKNDENENEECSCPICLRTISELVIVNSHSPRSAAVEINSSIDSTSDEGLVYSSTCKHIYCVPCIQQILLYSSSVSLSQRTSTNVKRLKNDETTPVCSIISLTQGLCPLCRAELSYFDLKMIHIQKNDMSNNTKYKIIRTDETLVPKDEISTLPNELYGKKFQSDTTLTFLQFPKDKYNDTGIVLCLTSTNRVDDNPSCFLSMTLQGYQYLSATHTIKGWGTQSIKDGKTKVNYFLDYEVWMTFSDNYMFVTHGVCRFTISNPFYKFTSPQQYIHDKFSGVNINVYGENSENEMLRVINPITNTNLNNSIITTSPKRIIRYENSTYWGNIYCQKFKIGLASYHFIEKPVNSNMKEGEVSDSKNSSNWMAYISFEHVSTSSWLPLDNGRPLPSRVLFRNINCPDQYTFCGSICWEQDYNTTWYGSSRWDYIIKFDTKFMCIISGTVHWAKTNDATVAELKSSFGNDLIYVNAGLYDSFTEQMVSKYGDRMRELKESDSPLPILEMVSKFSVRRCELISDQLHAENVTSEMGFMLLHILKAATYNVNNVLIEILKEKPNSGIAAINCWMETKFNINPIDSEYYYE